MKKENALHITRENYEEYFILYIDNELNTDECQAVEDFAAQYADVAKEFDVLLKTKLVKDETIFFQHKEELLRTEGVTINESNYEEYFLLYVDDELSKAKREETELFVLQHPHLQAMFTVIKQTVLPLETITFENKNELLRVEEKRRFLLRPWVMAVAALFAGITITGWWFMQPDTNSNKVPKVAVTQKHLDSNHVAQQPVQLVDSSSKYYAVTPSTVNKNKAGSNEPVATVKEENKAVASSTIKEKAKSTITKNRQPQVADIKNDDDIAQQSTVPENITLKEDPNPFRIEQKTKGNKDVAVNNDKPHVNDETTDDEPNVTSSTYKPYTVGYKEINTQQDEEDKSLYVGGFNLNKDKVNGLLKKAGKLFGNKARREANNNQMHIDNTDNNQ